MGATAATASISARIADNVTDSERGAPHQYAPRIASPVLRSGQPRPDNLPPSTPLPSSGSILRLPRNARPEYAVQQDVDSDAHHAVLAEVRPPAAPELWPPCYRKRTNRHRSERNGWQSQLYLDTAAR